MKFIFVVKTHSKFFHRTESESIENLEKLNNPEEVEEVARNSLEETDPFNSAASTTEASSVEIAKPNDIEYGESDEDGEVEEDLPKSKITESLHSENITDECRGDDKVRCGKTSVYICGVQKCDGVPNCPNAEDEENCPSNENTHSIDVEGSGEEPDVEVPEVKTPEIEETPRTEDLSVEPTPGDFLFYYFPNFVNTFYEFLFWVFQSLCR